MAAVAALGAWLVRARSGSAGRPNVLLITIDTLRADRLGCYGARDGATPVLDALAARGVRFETAIAATPLTAPSHASILTGLNPPRHGVRDNGDFVLPEDVATLAEAFASDGYATAAFVSGFPLDRRFGFARGFGLYDDRLPHGLDRRRAPYVERAADQTTAAALAWLATARAPWFAWVHYFDPHAPYEPPAAFAARAGGRLYEGEVAFVDAELGRLLQPLETVRERTLVLVTADHGESLGEHGEDTHGVFVYDATLRVPWLLAGPGVAGGRVVRTPVRGIDVAPTLLALSGLAAMKPVHGRSVAAAAAGQPLEDAPAYAESLFVNRHLGWAPLHAWRTARYKYVEAPRPELYALDGDPAEAHDRAAEQQAVADAMRLPLQAAIADARVTRAAPADAEASERLRALGYLGSAARGKSGSGRDPKDGVALIARLERGLAEARSQPRLALRELDAVLAEDPGIALARRYRAIALASSGDAEAAAAELRRLDRDGAASADDLALLGDSLRLAGRPADAFDPLERAARLQPRSPEPLLAQARAHLALDRPAEAARAFERALAVSPGNPEALRGLGDVALARGDLADAERSYAAILAADPGDVGAQVKLGVVRVRSGRVGEALALLRDAVGRAPDNPEALLTLGGALAKSGRAGEAVPLLEKAARTGPPSTLAWNSLGFARLESGDARGALDALRASLAIDPGQPPIAEVVARLAREGAAPRTPARP